ncbi:MAG TPA: hypothetical protein VN872_06460 [Candidatus Acidoferrum sp.]|nr:hypothetical protein [Candidatus Acidoferrum sp.]
MLADLKRMPRYTCVQTITRTYYEAKHPFERPSCSSLIAAHDTRKKKLPVQGWDRLRLEVALVDGNSVYSWVGAPRFADDTLEKLAGSGPLGSGDFGVFLNGILHRATLVFQGERVVDGSRLFEYSYQIPIGQSSYRVKVPEGWAITGYSGTLLLDPEADDLVRLVVRTDELPSVSSACQATSEVTYRRTPIHQRMVLVPHETQLYTINADGSEAMSQTSYANCREYSSTVKMIFGGESTSASPAPAGTPAAALAPLPAGIHFSAHITTPLDTDTAAAGDPIEAVLSAPMRGKKKEVIAPAGARLHGRLRTVKWWTDPSDLLQIAVQFESLEIGSAKVPLNAVLYLPSQPMFIGTSPYRMRSLKPDDPLIGGTFFFKEVRLRPKQLDSEWITVAPNEKKEKK